MTAFDASRKETSHRFPAFLPDGEHFLYAALPGSGGALDIFAGFISGGARESIGTLETSPAYAAPGWLIFLRQGVIAAQAFDPVRRRLSGEIISLDDSPGGPSDPSTSWTAGQVASVAADGTMAYLSNPVTHTQIVRLDTSGRVAGVVPLPRGYYTQVAVAPDGLRAAVVRQASRTESTIFLLDLARSTLVALTSGRGASATPVWSPDGRSIVFASDRDGASDFFLKDVTTAEPERVFYRSAALFKGPTDWSKNGLVVFQQLDVDRLQNVWTLPAAGGGEPTKSVDTPAREIGGRLSPDGRWLAYLSDDTGTLNAYVQPFPGPGPAVPLTTTGAYGISWRPDGRQIVLIGAERADLMSVDVEPGATLRAAPPRVLGNLPKGLIWIDAAPDLRQFLAVVPESQVSTHTITLITNWPAALAERARTGRR